MFRIIFSWCFIILILCNPLGCATSIHKIYQPEKFDLIIASEEDILDAAYEAMLELYPHSLFLPLLSSQSGYYWHAEEYCLVGYIYFYEYTIDEEFFYIRKNCQFEIRFEESLGLTQGGSIIMGYRYFILSYGNAYINDQTNMHDLDIVFRDALFKKGIEKIEVEEVL